MKGKPFSLHKRGKIWYAQLKLPDGSFSNARSTGERARGRAETWCVEQLKAGQVVVRTSDSFRTFAQDFFAWDGGWATDKRASGKRISPRHCDERGALLLNHILPAFGNYKLAEIDRGAIKLFRNKLHKDGLSGGSINKILSVLKAILTAAEENSLIRAVPRIDRAADQPKSRGILSVDEVRRLFSIPWEDQRAYVCNRIAACTGLRRGELLALTVGDVRGNYLSISRSYDERSREMNTTTKTGRARTVIVPPIVRQEIESLINSSPWEGPSAFLFYSSLADKPMEGSFAVDAFYAALDKIGISEAERKARNITFHSHRHFVNSILINARVPLQRVQMITGHLTNEMTQRYYHAEDNLCDILAIQEELFITGEC